MVSDGRSGSLHKACRFTAPVRQVQIRQPCTWAQSPSSTGLAQPGRPCVFSCCVVDGAGGSGRQPSDIPEAGIRRCRVALRSGFTFRSTADTQFDGLTTGNRTCFSPLVQCATALYNQLSAILTQWATGHDHRNTHTNNGGYHRYPPSKWICLLGGHHRLSRQF